MYQWSGLKEKLSADGYAVMDHVFPTDDIQMMLNIIEKHSNPDLSLDKVKGHYAIRRFLIEIPQICGLIFSEKVKTIIKQVFGEGYFVVKSIYFDKPPLSNWFEAYHQDTTVSVDRKTDLPGYRSWTQKQTQYAVQPPIHILQTIFTIRIHLDDTDENNGALRVIPGSHLNGIGIKINETERSCAVKSGRDADAPLAASCIQPYQK